MLAVIPSGTTYGLDAVEIAVEVDVSSKGLPSLTVVGLPDKAVQESRERVRSALLNSGAEIPARRITINLAPADIPKAGPVFDLPIAVGLLVASGAIDPLKHKSLFFGELSLDGTLRHTAGSLPIALLAKSQAYQTLYLPADSAPEVSFIKGLQIIPVETIEALALHLQGTHPLAPQPYRSLQGLLASPQFDTDFADVYGQEQSKRALEIAAAGAHNVHLTGLPGAGKTMLSRALPGILPMFTEAEALEVTKIYSISGLVDPDQGIVSHRPFRAPHHTTSKVGLIGGGSLPQPGEISLAHRGVLFLDEFPEFPRSIIESLRQPLEDGIVQISRAKQRLTYPARFMLIAASNPCPCGHLGDPHKACTCSQIQISRYQKKISGPMMDRIDLHVSVPSVEVHKLVKPHSAESSEKIRTRVEQARQLQLKRFASIGIFTNSEMSTKQVKLLCPLDSQSTAFLSQAATRLNLSARSYFKVIKVARTIADLESASEIATSHLAEALQFRPQTFI